MDVYTTVKIKNEEHEKSIGIVSETFPVSNDVKVWLVSGKEIIENAANVTELDDSTLSQKEKEMLDTFAYEISFRHLSDLLEMKKRKAV